MTLTISSHPLPTDDAAVVADAYAVMHASYQHGREFAPQMTPQAFGGWITSPDEGERKWLLLGRDEAGTPVAVAMVFVPLLDNLDKVYLEAGVHPDHRGRGYGSALLARVLDEVRSLGRTQVITDTKVPSDEVDTHAYRRFLERRGFRCGNVEVVRHLPLPIPEHDLDTWAAQAAQKHGDYTLETFTTEFPEDLIPSLCELFGMLALDAPTGELDFEAEVFTPERFAERLALIARQDRVAYETLALTPDRRVVAHSTLAVPLDGETTDAFQWGTLVHREHRGHRLGLAVKTRNLQIVQREHPHLRRVTTQNAETNEWMIAVNELLGFRPVEASLEMLAEL